MELRQGEKWKKLFAREKNQSMSPKNFEVCLLHIALLYKLDLTTYEYIEREREM